MSNRPNYSLWDSMQRRIAEIQKEKECSEDEAIRLFNQEQRDNSSEVWDKFIATKEEPTQREKERLEKLAKRFGIK